MSKRDVKVVDFRDDVLTVRIKGVEYCYLVSRCEPLTSQDASFVRAAMDARWIEGMNRIMVRQNARSGKTAASLLSPLLGLMSPSVPSFDGAKIADYLEGAGIVEGDFVVVPKEVINNIRNTTFK